MTTESTESTQLNIEIKAKLDDLQAALLASDPQMPTLLRDIHRVLKAQPDQVTLMTENEVAIVVAGLQKQTNTNLAELTLSRGKSASKLTRAKLAAMTAEDLGF